MNPYEEDASVESMTSGRKLRRNTIWNMAGQVVPLIVAVFATPLLIKGLELDRFGILTLIWVFVGYFSLFDLGIGRALTYLVAKKEGSGERGDVPAVAYTALLAGLILGVVGSCVVAMISPWLVRWALKVPKHLHEESLIALYWVAASVPVVILTAGLKGLLQARHRFDLVNIVGFPIGVLNFVGPLLIMPFSHNLAYVTAMLVLGRAVACLVYFRMCLKVFPELREGYLTPRMGHLKELFHFGGWLTVSNIVGPLTLYTDRFLIGSIVSVTYVAYYTVPYEMITKLLIITGAINGVVFPAFSAVYAHDKGQACRLFFSSTKNAFLITYPLVLFAVIFAPEMLTLWLGHGFSAESTIVLQVIGAGVFVFGLSGIPSMLIQAVGRPDFLTKLNLLELPFYVAMIWFLTTHDGIEGTAIAWFLRVSFDTAAIAFYASRFVSMDNFVYFKPVASMGLALASFSTALIEMGFTMKVFMFLLEAGLFIMLSWKYLLCSNERCAIVKRVRVTFFSGISSK